VQIASVLEMSTPGKPKKARKAKKQEPKKAPAFASQGTLGALNVPTGNLMMLMRFLSVKDLRRSVHLVCKEMRALSLNPLTSSVDLSFLARGGKQGVTKLFSALEELNSTQAHLTSLKVGNYNWGKTSFKKLTKACPLLRDVDLGTSKMPKPNPFQDLSVSEAPNLRSFALGWCYDIQQHNYLTFLSGRSQLECLTLSNCELMCQAGYVVLNDHFLNTLATNCQRLKLLHVSGANVFTDPGVAALVSGCPLLLSLDLRLNCVFDKPDLRGSITNESRALLRSRPNLVFHLSGWPHAPE
jgi:hypothetical protein